MMKSSDLRNLRRITREVTGWAREIEAATRPKSTAAAIQPARPKPAPAPSPKYSLPPGYALVTCKDCEAPAVLIHHAQYSYAALCPECRVITHLETIEAIDQERSK